MANDLTIMLPAYNEEKSIGLVIDEIRALPIECEILIGDNNSVDSTYNIVLSKGIEPIKVWRKGKGNVIQLLSRYIETPYVIMVNSDYTYPLKYVQTIYNLLNMGLYDIVIGCRELKEKDSMSIINSIGNSFLSIWASLLYQRRVYDICSGMWGFKTTTLEAFSITSEGFTLEADLFSNAIKNGCKIVQIPIGYRARLDGSKAKLKIWDGFKIAWFLLKRRF